MSLSVWEKYGYTRQQWQRLPWKQLRKYLYKEGYGNFWSYHFPTICRAVSAFKLWYNKPAGGYLFAAWCKHNAETETMIYNYPRLKYLRNGR